MPIYKVVSTISGDDSTSRTRLINASNQAAALKHVVADTITVKAAEPHEIHECAKAGVEIEAVSNG